MKFYRFGNYTAIDFHCKIERCIIFYELEFLRIFLSLADEYLYSYKIANFN